MRVTVLIENDGLEGRDDLTAEFGLSLLVEHGESSVLFDTGTTGAFADNAAVLGLDISKVDAAVLSHHHFDHGGGLERFFELNRQTPVYLRRAEHRQRVFKLLGVLKRPIGIDLGLFDRFADRMVEIDATTEIAPDVFLLVDTGEGHPRPRGNRYLRVEGEHGAEPDPFDHELTMVVRESDGMTVFTGCSHNGVLNMVDAAIAAFPGVPVKTVIGGFHQIGLPFFNTMTGSRSEVEGIARELGDRCRGQIITGHCTGPKAYAVLESVLGDRLRTFPTGTVLEL